MGGAQGAVLGGGAERDWSGAERGEAKTLILETSPPPAPVGGDVG